MSILVDMPFPIFVDVDGKPLDEGYIFVGVAGLNPITNPLTVYWDPDLTIPATAIRTIHGFPSYRGSPGVLYTSTNYSILVRNRQGINIYSNLNSVNYLTDAKKIFGDYEVETTIIPGSTDKKIKVTNKQTGKYFTITETRSPDGTTVEATHSLGAVADGIDWIFDFSMHNYDAGIMKGVHVLQCFNADAKGAMYWVIRHRPTGETDYGLMEDYYMMKLDETNGLQVNAAASEGVAPTWVKVLTKDNLNTELASGWSELLLTALGAGWLNMLSKPNRYVACQTVTNLLIAALTLRTTLNLTYLKLKEIVIDKGGTINVEFTLGAIGSTGTAYASVFINNSRVGIERAVVYPNETTFTETFTVSAGDLIQIYAKSSNGATGAAVKNMKLGATVTSLEVLLD